MSKMSELDLLVQELKKCGESLMNIADELTGIFSETGEKKTEAPAEPVMFTRLSPHFFNS